MQKRILGVFLQRSTLFTSSNHGLQRNGDRDEAGAETGVGSAKPHWVLLETLYYIASSNHGLQRKGDKTQKRPGEKSLGHFRVDYFLMLYFVPSRDACNASTLASPSTVATFVSRLTSTFVTPGTFEKRSFTVLAHPAHLIPSKLYSFFIKNLSFKVMLSSVLILGR